MRKTLVKLMIIVLILGVALCNYSIAADTATAQLEFTGVSNSYNKGSEIQIPLKIKNITGTGFAAIGADYEYNSNIFENVSFQQETGWETPVDYEGHFDVYTSSLENVTTDQNVLTLKANIKSNAANGTYQIKLTNVELAGDASYEISEVVATIVVNNSTTPTNNTVNNTTVNNTVVNNTVTNNVVNNAVVNNTVTNNVVNNTVVNNTVRNNTVNNTNVTNNAINSIIPYVGMNTPMFGVGIVVLIIAAGTAIYKYNKYKSLK